MSLILDLVFLNSDSIVVLNKIATLSRAVYDRYCSIYTNNTKITLVISFESLSWPIMCEYYELRHYNISYWRIMSDLLELEFASHLSSDGHIIFADGDLSERTYTYTKVKIGGKSEFVHHLANVLKITYVII